VLNGYVYSLPYLRNKSEQKPKGIIIYYEQI
jgi:hypothetical protein